MPTLTTPTIATFLGSLTFQFIGLALLPITRGFTAPWQTFLCLLAFLIGLTCSARLIHNGVELSLLAPLLTVLLQVLALIVGIAVYGESASFAKIGLVVLSALLIGVASSL